MKALTIVASAGALLCTFVLASAQDIPKGNHYVCYPVKVETFKQRTATFVDQFGTWKMTVIKPVQLCTPAEKRIEKTVFPMIDPKLHVLCYEVKYEGKTPPKVQVTDQFGVLKMGLNPATTVCLPASKLVLK